MIAVDIISSRIDSLTEGLAVAVQKPDGAQFALMLSMIAESQQLALRAQSQSGSAPLDVKAAIDNRHELYSAEIVGRLNQALKLGQQGDFTLLLSWLETVPLAGRKRLVAQPEPVEGVSLSQAALMAGRYPMLDEVRESRLKVAA